MPFIVRVGDPLWINRALSTRDTRVATAGMLAAIPDPDQPAARAGVLPAPDPAGLRVTPTAPQPTMAVVVTPGHAVITQTAHGAWVAPVEQAVTLDVPAAPATGSRLDLVVLRVVDLDQGDTAPVTPDPGARGLAVVELLAGQPSATPTAPPVPARALVLAHLTAAAGTTTVTADTITDRRVWTVARGGVRPTTAADTTPAGHVGEITAAPTGLLRVVADPAGYGAYRGVQALPAREVPVGPVGWQTQSRDIGKITIPYPGFPYQLDVRGTLNLIIDSGVSLTLSVDTSQYVPACYDIAVSEPGRHTVNLGAPTARLFFTDLTVTVKVRYATDTSGGRWQVFGDSSGVTVRAVPWVGP